MEKDILFDTGDNLKELEKYIKQIKKYETQAVYLEEAADMEKNLKRLKTNWVLVLWTGIAGIDFYINTSTEEGKKILGKLIPGTELRLVRQTDNKFDRWAIAIYTIENIIVGYVTRFKNETIARLIDNGYRFHAFVEDGMKANQQIPKEQHAPTEDFDLIFSVWMET